MSILAFLTELLRVIPKLIELGDRIAKQIEQGKIDAWVDKLETAVTLAEKAETSEDRIAAARAWADVLRSMRRRS